MLAKLRALINRLLRRPTRHGEIADPIVPGETDADQRIPGQSPDIDYPPGTPGNPTAPGEVLVDHP
jgi:hypothetical protein